MFLCAFSARYLVLDPELRHLFIRWLLCIHFVYCFDWMGVHLCGTVAHNGPIIHPPDDTRMNMKRWNDADRRNGRTWRKP
jgi:hypothetical protein